MKTTVKQMTEERNHEHQDITIQQLAKDTTKAQAELEARLKTQEYKEMLKRLK